jgi:hypothetical protein
MKIKNIDIKYLKEYAKEKSELKEDKYSIYYNITDDCFDMFYHNGWHYDIEYISKEDLEFMKCKINIYEYNEEELYELNKYYKNYDESELIEELKNKIECFYKLMKEKNNKKNKFLIKEVKRINKTINKLNGYN